MSVASSRLLAQTNRAEASAGLNGSGGRSLIRTSHVAAATNTGTAATNNPVVLTFAAVSNSHLLGGISASYSAAPTGGGITITDGGTTIYQSDIILGGVTNIQFNPPLRSASNSALVITLAAGGSGITGKLNALGKGTE